VLEALSRRWDTGVVDADIQNITVKVALTPVRWEERAYPLITALTEVALEVKFTLWAWRRELTRAIETALTQRAIEVDDTLRVRWRKLTAPVDTALTLRTVEIHHTVRGRWRELTGSTDTALIG
jgi:hypothetical protein